MLTRAQRRVLARPAFRRLWIATAISELGSNIGRMAFILLVHELAREAGAVPGQPPNPSLAPTHPGGCLWDRVKERTVTGFSAGIFDSRHA